MNNRQCSPSSATTINSWGVVRARTMLAVITHAVMIGIIGSILNGTWNFILGTEFGYNSTQSWGMAIGMTLILLVVRFVWSRTPASAGGGYQGH